MSETALWFENLAIVQARVKDLNTSTKDNLYEFSLQALKVLSTDLLRQNLCSYCQSKKIGFCRSNTFDDLTNDFRWFLDHIETPIVEILVFTSFDIARNRFVPPYAGMLVKKFRVEPVAKVCTSPSNQAILTSLVFADIPRDFYMKKPDLVADAIAKGWTFQKLCEEIVR